MVGRHSNNFDFIRFVAASFVLFTHSFTVLKLEPKYDVLYIVSSGKSSLSELGVQVFFVLSGYLIYQSLLNSRNVFDYLFKRALRIFPALIVVITLATFILGPLVTSLGPSQYFQHTGELLTYLSGIFIYPINYVLPGVFLDHPYPKVNISLWTIPYEFTCYWVLPLVLLPLRLLKLKLVHILGGFVLLLAGVSSIFYIKGTHEFGIPYLNIGMFRFLHLGLFFFSGALLYELKFLIKKDINIFWVLGLIALWIGSMYVPKLGLFCDFLFLPIIVLNLSFIKGRFNNFGKHGDFSYGMYLYGFIAQQLVVYANVTTSAVVLFLLAYPLTLLFGYISWHTVEKKALSYKNLLKPKVAV